MTVTRKEVKMVFDYSRLRGKIVEVCGSRKAFAERAGMAYITLLNKTANRSQWTQAEIVEACSILGIDCSEIPDYFFVRRVKKL